MQDQAGCSGRSAAATLSGLLRLAEGPAQGTGPGALPALWRADTAQRAESNACGAGAGTIMAKAGRGQRGQLQSHRATLQHREGQQFPNKLSSHLLHGTVTLQPQAFAQQKPKNAPQKAC